ncbi:hypothetical protein GRI38_01715 [Altererythrobacter aurantiacus]|uniref:Helix-turn-helix domain-containing protein n=1 Tax=Parapontixanthobacter aurantiacus TaxID=1463599 RepID=A0A844ZBW6_9SPHN|nr:hypothetical protein [Parapontixanthobacter aurantiacus]MXO84752.1 hypothetical protein [Parapontixanthobacter aurantiacus]
MAKTKNRKRAVDKTGRNKHEKFVMLESFLLKSAAYRLLSPQARALLVEFLHLYNGVNNREIYMSQRQAADLLNVKMHRTAGKYIQELEEKGFVRTIVKGSFDNKQPLASVYELTMKDVGERHATKDFMRYRPTDKEKRRMQNMRLPWLEKRPTGLNNLPNGFLDVGRNQPRHDEFSDANVGEICSTYNIPAEGDNSGDDQLRDAA